MDLNEIIKRAASAYPDEHILCHWDITRQCPVHDSRSGDSLAAFIASELSESYDDDAGERKQIDTAIRVMRSAVDQLQAVVTSLQALIQERSTCD